jgi:hypothetical protein
MICSTNIDGANTGTLTPDQLGSREVDGVGLADEGAGEAATHDALWRILLHSCANDFWFAFLRHHFRPCVSAEEDSEPFGEGEMEAKKKGDVP